MYEQFYGLKDKPFSMLPDPDFLFLSKKHQAALTLLEYGLMNNVGFCVVSGETGAGKTTVLRKLLGRIDQSYRIGMITNTHQSFGSLLDWMLSAFNLHDPNLSHVEMHQKFMDFLISEYANNKKVLLIVDEAQNMNAATLEELRMLSNVNSEKDQLMQVILAGQPALKDTLRIPELMQFAQRIGVDFHLDDLDVKETCCYIQHRLKTAGATRNIFTPEACARIHGYSGGTPRLINLLCDTVMVYGFADQEEKISVALIDEMVLERMKDSVVPLAARGGLADLTEDEKADLEKDFPWIDESIIEEVAVDDDSVEPSETEKIESTASLDGSPVIAAETIPVSQVDKLSAQTQPEPVKNIVNKVECLEETSIDVTPNKWWLYAGVAALVIVVVVILYRSDVLLSSEGSQASYISTGSRDKVVTQEKALYQKEQALLELEKQKKKKTS